MVSEIETTRLVSAEDLRIGDYITVMSVTRELAPLFISEENWRHELEVVRVRMTPDCAGVPMKVVKVCVPFVLVKAPNGRHGTLDVRRHRLARLSRAYGKATFRRLRRDLAAKDTAD